MASNPNLATTSEAVQAWRDDRENMTDAELSGLTREGVILHDLNARVYLRVVEEPAERGPESERSVTFEDHRAERVEYQLDHLRSYLTGGELASSIACWGIVRVGLRGIGRVDVVSHGIWESRRTRRWRVSRGPCG